MNNETKAQAKEAKVRQPWTAKRVGDLLLNNALLIIMAIAVIYIAIKNPNFIKPASLINILSQTAAYLPAALGIAVHSRSRSSLLTRSNTPVSETSCSIQKYSSIHGPFCVCFSGL